MTNANKEFSCLFCFTPSLIKEGWYVLQSNIMIHCITCLRRIIIPLTFGSAHFVIVIRIGESFRPLEKKRLRSDVFKWKRNDPLSVSIEKKILSLFFRLHFDHLFNYGSLFLFGKERNRRFVFHATSCFL